jgi:NAD(P)-dependent dehydrogenase (short-subunit alcohol dehydrogenase family)
VKLEGKRVVVTGAARGIGAAMAERFRREGASVLTADLSGADFDCDVTDPAQLRSLIEHAGEIEVFCSNAGVSTLGGPEEDDEKWQWVWDVNVMAHVRAARLLLPAWVARGSGYFVQTVSAAALGTMLGSAPYSVTKHAALALAEWMSITYYDQGIRISAICPLGVRTAMYHQAVDAGLRFLEEDAIDVEDVAEAAVRGIDEERFLILPHSQVQKFFQSKAADYERWLGKMRQIQRQFPYNHKE